MHNVNVARCLTEQATVNKPWMHNIVSGKHLHYVFHVDLIISGRKTRIAEKNKSLLIHYIINHTILYNNVLC